jgi:hypothetical protein
MRRPVDVKSYCGWVSSYPMFSSARISGDLWLARRPSRPSAASSSGALTAAGARHSSALRAKENMGILLSRSVSHHCHVELRLSSHFHPTLGERLRRSVHIGYSRYSRRCHLLGRPLVPSVDGAGQGQGRSRRNSTFRVVHSSFSSELCRCQSSLSRIVERLVLLATDPEMMEQHGKLACDGDDCPFMSLGHEPRYA